MTWKDAGSYIAKYLPLVGSVIGGKAGEQVGELAARALGVPAEPEKVIAELQGNPDALIKLREFELSMQVELQKLRLGTLTAEFADTANARGTEVERMKVTGKQDINLYVLAWVVVGGFFGTIIGIVALKIMAPTVNLNNEPLLSLLLGSLSTDAGMVVGYFFGSSKSSSEKTALLANKPAQPEA